MQDAILAVVRDRGEAAFPDIDAAVAGDTGSVFLACRRLERRGEVRSVRPLVYRRTDASSTDPDAGLTDGGQATDGGRAGDGGRPTDGDDGFVWVEFDD